MTKADLQSLAARVEAGSGHHVGDPCIKCGVSHDEVAVGPCLGRIVAYCIIRQSWQNPASRCDNVLILHNSGVVTQEARHPSEHWWMSDRFKRARAFPSENDLRALAAQQQDRPIEGE